MIVFCDWKARWWNDQQTDGRDMEGLSDELAEGLLAYAGRQAAIEVSLADRFTQNWAAVRKRAQPLIARFWGTDSDDMDITMSEPEEEEVVEFLVGEEDDDAGGGSDFDD